MNEKEVKILIYDIEVTPILAYTYSLFNTNVVKKISDPILMSFSYRWYGKKKVHHFSLPDFQTYKVDKTNDKLLVKELWDILDEADIVIGHNSNGFDNKMSTAFFLKHGFGPPSPYAKVDTYQAHKRIARVPSNSLNSLGERYELGTKTGEKHSDLWYPCLNGDMKAWKKMVKYNDQDVNITYRLYEKLRPWISNHPNLARLSNKPDICIGCGADSSKIQSRGTQTTAVCVYRRYQCQECGKWLKNRIPLDKTADVKPKMTNIPGA